MRRIAIIIGSLSDLKQCREGLAFLTEHKSKVEVIGVYIRSQHRNTLQLQQLLMELAKAGLDAIIVGAGWANHLTGCCDAFLRYELKSTACPVVGVGFEDLDNAKHTHAAILSVTEVPGTQVIFQSHDAKFFLGPSGFLQACQLATYGRLPVITLPTPKPPQDLSLAEAWELAGQ